MNCNKEDNIEKCSCTYEPCSRKGICCECVLYHRKNNEAPACLFPREVEKTYNRSLERLASCYNKKHLQYKSFGPNHQKCFRGNDDR